MTTQRYEAVDASTRAATGKRGFLAGVESLAALISTLFLALGVILLCLMCVIDAAGHGGAVHLAWTLFVALLASAADIYFVALVLQGFFSHAPKLPVAVAMRQYLLPWPLRPFLAAYWLLHFAAGAFMAVGMEHVMITGHRSGRMGAGELVFAMVLGYVFTYAANAYLLAAVAALTRNSRVLVITWRLRLLTDLIVAVGVPLLMANFRPG